MWTSADFVYFICLLLWLVRPSVRPFAAQSAQPGLKLSEAPSVLRHQTSITVTRIIFVLLQKLQLRRLDWFAETCFPVAKPLLENADARPYDRRQPLTAVRGGRREDRGLGQISNLISLWSLKKCYRTSSEQQCNNTTSQSSPEEWPSHICNSSWRIFTSHKEATRKI